MYLDSADLASNEANSGLKNIEGVDVGGGGGVPAGSAKFDMFAGLRFGLDSGDIVGNEDSQMQYLQEHGVSLGVPKTLLAAEIK